MDGIWLGLLIGGLTGAFAGRRFIGPRHMPHRREWERKLAQKRGAVEAACLMARAEARYEHRRRPQELFRIPERMGCIEADGDSESWPDYEGSRGSVPHREAAVAAVRPSFEADLAAVGQGQPRVSQQ